jgi:hypothetical protein
MGGQNKAVTPVRILSAWPNGPTANPLQPTSMHRLGQNRGRHVLIWFGPETRGIPLED